MHRRIRSTASAWSGGSVQVFDTPAVLTPAERESGVFRSGTGIEPDEVVVQLQSDLLTDTDTMLTRARGWVTTGLFDAQSRLTVRAA